MHSVKRILSYIYIPILFLLVGYGIFFLAAQPLIDFVGNTVNLITLDRPPKFNQSQTTSLFKKAVTNQSQQLKAANLDLPSYGDQFGQLRIPDANLQQPLYYGDGDTELAKGVGMFNGSRFPGEPGATLIAGHNVSAMANLGRVKLKQSIIIQTNYGTYTYKVTDKKVAKYTDAKAFDLNGNKARVILYTCYPLNMVGLTPDRLVVYGDLVSGPTIKM